MPVACLLPLDREINLGIGRSLLNGGVNLNLIVWWESIRVALIGRSLEMNGAGVVRMFGTCDKKSVFLTGGSCVVFSDFPVLILWIWDEVGNRPCRSINITAFTGH